MVQHHPSDEALVSPFHRNRDNLLSITSHLENGVDGVYEFANAWGVCRKGGETDTVGKEVPHSVTVSIVSRILITTVL